MRKNHSLMLIGFLSMSLIIASCGNNQQEQKFTITFLNDDKTQLSVVEVKNGEMPVYDKEAPTKESNAQYTYTFSGWTPELVVASKDTTYTATYSSTLRKYTVTFYDEDGTTVLDTQQVEYGTVPTSSVVPTKEQTESTVYTFAGWDPAPVAVSGEASYKATYSSGVRKYQITFYDEDGTTVLDTQQVEYGVIPTTTVSPTKEQTESKVFTFNGWDPAPVAVTGEASYKATYSEVARKYTIQFVSGEDVLQTESLEYGVTPSYKGDEPTKATTEGITYVFDSWDKEIVPVDGDATYSAIFHEIDSHGICLHCGQFLGAKKIADFAIKDAKANEVATPAPGFTNVYGKASFDNGPVGADVDISKYVTIYFALSHQMSYGYVFGGSDAYAKLWRGDWYQILLEKDSDLNWHAFFKMPTDTTWTESKLGTDEDKSDLRATNLSTILKMYNWNADERAAAQLLCSEVYASDKHEHAADQYGICKFCGILVDSEKACDSAVNNAQPIDEVAPRGFNIVSSISGLANGNAGTSFDVTKYKVLYFSMWHDISYIYLFGGNNAVNPTLWQADWYNVLLIKESSGWIAYFKKAYETTWTTDKTKVDGANDQNFSSILRLYNWQALSDANVKCTEVYGVLA